MPSDVIRRQPSPEHRARREALRALKGVVDRVGEWHRELAIVSVRAARPYSSSERDGMLSVCNRLSAELGEARSEIITGLLDAPQAISGHSRVVDVERALDVVEARIADLVNQLSGQA